MIPLHGSWRTAIRSLNPADTAVFAAYFAAVLALGWRASRRTRGAGRSAEDYFLAGRSLPWWVIGSSLIAANISTEQFIGMNGTAFESGLAVISYSWLGAAVPILLVARFFLPTFLRLKIYSLPEFLARRYDRRVSGGMSVYWVLLYVFVNLTSVLGLGAVTLNTVVGLPITSGVLALAGLSALYTIAGGLAAVAWTDLVQVAVLLGGGFAVIVRGLDALAPGGGVLAGFAALLRAAPEKFHTILPASHPELPWPGIFFGGLWIAALSYWGCNQYIIQRALAARSLKEARRGLLFAAFLSIVVSLPIVLPGIIASVLCPGLVAGRDQAFPVLVRELMPAGLLGLVIAGLVAAIVSSLNSMTNSAATIFTMDIYRNWVRPSASERELIRTGRIFSAAALLVAVALAPRVAALGRLFAFIQEYSGFVFPGVLTIFLLGLAYRRTTGDAALAAAVLSIPLSAALKFALPGLAFLNRMTLTFLILVALAVGISLFGKGTPRRRQRFGTGHVITSRPAPPLFEPAGPAAKTPRAEPVFTLGALAVLGIVAALYLIFR
jgi:SSS family solute:Na+ symporter